MKIQDNQRRYIAQCPNCGAELTFYSLANIAAVCSYCKSTLIRENDVWHKRGKVAEEFIDFSGLSLGCVGQTSKKYFTLVGRIQYRGASGTWTEWRVLFQDQTHAILSEDNGRYVIMWRLPSDVFQDITPEKLIQCTLGTKITLEKHTYVVSSVHKAHITAMEGEWDDLPTQNKVHVIELRNALGTVISIEIGENITYYQGTGITLNQLKLKTIASQKEIQGQALQCPHCGTAIQPRLIFSRSMTCPGCKQQVTWGVGEPPQALAIPKEIEPLIPIGRVGRIGQHGWQVVGFMVREGGVVAPGGEHFSWHEYLIFNKNKGFAFLVASSEDWYWYQTLSGATTHHEIISINNQTAKHDVTYVAKVKQVLGEFYWPVRIHDQAVVNEYVSGDHKITCETTEHEMVWSKGRSISSKELSTAFGVAEAALSQYSKTAKSGWGCLSISLIFACLILFIIWIIPSSKNTTEDCMKRYDPKSYLSYDEQMQRCLSESSRSGGSGGSGGWFSGGSSSGGHK